MCESGRLRKDIEIKEMIAEKFGEILTSIFGSAIQDYLIKMRNNL